MFHPEILRHALYLRTQCQRPMLDACADAAQFFGVRDVWALYQFVCTVHHAAPLTRFGV